jgi:hypothetical protein
MKFLSLSLLATGVFGAVSQYCTGFEDSKKPRQLTVEVGSDTSVLLYHITDVGSSNIPLVVNDEVLQLEPNGFGICTQKKASQGHCDAVGTFTVQLDNAQYDTINRVALAGEKVDYAVSKEGVYCAVMYQEGPELSHLKVVEKHSYGYLPLSLYEAMNVFHLLFALLIPTILALVYTFKGKKRACIGTIYQDIGLLLVAKFNQVAWKSLFLSIQNLFETNWMMKFVDVTTAIDMGYKVFTFVIFYKLSAGIFGFSKEDREKMTFQPPFRRCLLVMGLGGILASLQPLLRRLLPLQLFVFVGIISEIILSIVWIPMVYIMWKNSKVTHREIVDPVFAKKYHRSKICLICIPVAVSVISIASVLVIMNAISSGSYSRSGDFGSDMQGNFTSLLESSLNQHFLFVLLKHLSEFSMLFVQWAFLLIWKPHLLDRTEFENIHGDELAEGSGEVKL